MSGVEYSVSVRAKNGVSDMVPLELRNASITPVLMTSINIMISTSIMTSGSSHANLAPGPIIAGVVCSLVVIILLMAVIGVIV